MKKRLKTMLVAEDDSRIAKHIKMHILAAFNREIQVLIAKTIEGAKEIIEQGNCDMFLIDFGLPDGHGEELIKLIQEKSHLYPIIVQTAIDDVDYQLTILKGYDRLRYLTKNVLFKELTASVIWARREVDDALAHRLALPSRDISSSLLAYEVTYVEKVIDEKNLLIERYDFETKAYQVVTKKNMSLNGFISEYNELGIFLRCHTSFIVNIKMIEYIDHLTDEIVMLYPDAKGRPIRIPIGPTYVKEVEARTKGLY